MRAPVSYRRDIPFFHQKTAQEFQKDPYERYDEMVMRQAALHLADDFWGFYPFQTHLDLAQQYYPTSPNPHILELGCSVGRWIGTVALQHPEAHCWGIDYSYQMLRQAHELWVKGKGIAIDLGSIGCSKNFERPGHQLKNLQFGLSKAENLPFDDNSQDLIFNSFLLDRLENPTKGLEEMYRILKPNGTLILTTPLNFNQTSHWENYYPISKIATIVQQIGYTIDSWEDSIKIREPFDLHGNEVIWNCLQFIARKTI